MENKVLIKLILPELDITYDVYIPVNEVIWKVKLLLLKSVENMKNISNNNKECYLINKDNCKIYDNNEIVINTDIRNGSELLLVTN